QVELDRPVSLKEGERGGPTAKVQRMVCDKSVRMEDSVIENGNLLRYQSVQGPVVVVDNTDGKVNATGPGVVRILQPGARETPAPAGGRTGKPERTPGRPAN